MMDAAPEIAKMVSVKMRGEMVGVRSGICPEDVLTL
jgi:hypothetical protein